MLFQKFVLVVFLVICCTETCISASAPKEAYTIPDVTGHGNLHLLPTNSCGPVQDQSRILSGDKTGVFQFPWMAQLWYRNKTDNSLDYHCGGSIINNRYILTAAHCLVQFQIEPLEFVKVRLGEHNVDTDPDCDKDMDVNTMTEIKTCAESHQDFEFEETVVHPAYDQYLKVNDIALVRLAREVNLTSQANIKPICLPWHPRYSNRTDFDERPVTVAGWGLTERNVKSRDLLKIKLPYVQNGPCSEEYAKYTRFTRITGKQMCAGGLTLRDSCRGDSGGPLMVHMQNPEYKILTFEQGLVSFGPTPCGVRRLPGVYTRVAPYMDWILDNIKP